MFSQCCGVAQEQRYTRYGLWLGFCSCLLILQKKPPRENGHKQISSSSIGCLSSPNATIQSPKHEWKIVASEKTSSKCITLVRLPLVYFFLRRSFKLEPYHPFKLIEEKTQKQPNLEKSNRSSCVESGVQCRITTATESSKNCIFKNTELLCLQITLTCAWLCWTVFSVSFSFMGETAHRAHQQVLQNSLKV